MDLLMAGKVAQGLDILMSRFKAIQQSTLDGDEAVSKCFEMTPPDSKGSSLAREDQEYVEGIHAREAKRLKLLHDAGVG